MSAALARVITFHAVLDSLAMTLNPVLLIGLSIVTKSSNSDKQGKAWDIGALFSCNPARTAGQMVSLNWAANMYAWEESGIGLKIEIDLDVVCNHKSASPARRARTQTLMDMLRACLKSRGSRGRDRD